MDISHVAEVKDPGYYIPRVSLGIDLSRVPEQGGRKEDLDIRLFAFCGLTPSSHDKKPLLYHNRYQPGLLGNHFSPQPKVRSEECTKSIALISLFLWS